MDGNRRTGQAGATWKHARGEHIRAVVDFAFLQEILCVVLANVDNMRQVRGRRTRRHAVHEVVTVSARTR
jgi:hypothetical protein